MLWGKHINFIFIGIAIIVLMGCGPQKKISSKKATSVEETGPEMISLLERNSHLFHTVKFRKVEFDFSMNGIREKVRGNIAIYRDSLIAVSVVPVLGYEMLRILCTKDSVIVINRPEKNYYASSFEHYRMKYGIPVGFNELQAILTNEVFNYKDNYGDRIYERQLSTRNGNNLYLVDAFKEEHRITNQGIEIGRESRQLENLFIVDYELQMSMNLHYYDFTGSENLVFPKMLKLEIIESNNSIKLEMYYGQIIFDDSLNIEFAVPGQYTRGDM